MADLKSVEQTPQSIQSYANHQTPDPNTAQRSTNEKDKESQAIEVEMQMSQVKTMFDKRTNNSAFSSQITPSNHNLTSS